MQDAIQQIADAQTEKKSKGFNFNKLQAVLCIVASSVVSVSLITWLVKSFF